MKNQYAWLNLQLNKSLSSNVGFTQLVATEPFVLSSSVTAQRRNIVIREFQNGCLHLLQSAFDSNDKEILKWLINDTPESMGEAYLRKLPDIFWKVPVFFRTDESALGKIFEIQCPGSLWGELELLYNFYKKAGLEIQIEQPAQVFTDQLVQYLNLDKGKSPLVYYLTDNASIPIGVRYFISQTRMTTPPIRYWGIDKYPSIEVIDENGKCVKQLKAIDSDFVRTHYYLELFGECDFHRRIFTDKRDNCYDLPPMSLFDQKAILALPFWDKTKQYFSQEIRDILAYTTPLIDDSICLESGETLTIDEFAALPQSQRKYYLKYAGTDGSVNWGSRSVTSIEKIGREKLAELLKEKVSDFKNNSRPWVLQSESKGEKESVSYYDKSGSIRTDENKNTKYSYFYGPYSVLGGVVSYRKTNLVHGQSDTIIKLIDLKL